MQGKLIVAFYRILVYLFIFLLFILPHCNFDQTVRPFTDHEKWLIKQYKNYKVYIFFVKERVLNPKKIYKWIEIHNYLKNKTEKKLLFELLSKRILENNLKDILLYLKYEDKYTKKSVLGFIKKIKSPKFLRQLYQLLQNPNKRISHYSAIILSKFPTNKLVQFLSLNRSQHIPYQTKILIIRLFLNKKSIYSLDYLFSIYSLKDQYLKSQIIFVYKNILIKNPNKLLPFLIYKLNSTNISTKLKALSILTILERPQSLIPIFNQLNNSNFTIRRKISKSLVPLVNNKTQSFFYQALKIENHFIRNEIIWILGESCFKPALNYLIPYLNHSDPQTVIMCILSLVKFRVNNLSKLLINKMADKSMNIRITSIWAYSQLKPIIIPKVLIKYLDDKNDIIRKYASWSVIKISNKKNIDLLLNNYNTNPNFIKILLKVLVKLKYHKGIYVIQKIIKSSKNLQIKLEAIKGLSILSHKKALVYLKDLYKSNNPDIRIQVVKLLGQLKKKGYYKLLTKALNDSNPEVRKQAIISIRYLNIKKQNKIKLIKTKLRDRNNIVRQTARTILLLINYYGNKKYLRIF